MKINDILGVNVENLKNLKEAKKKEEAFASEVRRKGEGKPQEVSPAVVELSSKKVVENAVKKAASLPEIREEKVSQIKAQIEAGTYNVSNREIARAMVGSLLNEIA
ncbi:flagellar biosynthesis anti-sigma factor FlgM [Thermodesulfobacterium sp. TA1]|uniref:flagellar biosynthesis anti-sigma factor FlgM n=1 Tax=Thermodesulfobacterium sp. TA1 TaxID=2234087 RepID=UPI001232391F|nr:flagellar biosynthesis anti-sigma factor FlgM [Thermodesulfobacterium sp. TA1]QER42502.1 flagellar biosynthesis anti-sigma factor FlgM [Thermodesulfobacterium sp. TA1]